MSERLMMEGKLVGLKQEGVALHHRMEGLCALIREKLNSSLTPVEEMEIALTAAHMDDLVMAQAEILAVNAQIRRINAELGR